MELTGSGIKLRPVRDDDADALVRYGNNRNVWINLTNAFPHPYTLQEAQAWPRIANQEPEHGRRFAIDIDDELIGVVGFSRLRDLGTRTAEIGYWLGEPFWGRGIALIALQLATSAAFDHYDFVRLQAGVLSWNPRSTRVLEKAGYEHEATLRRARFKDGKVCDCVMYAKLRE